MPSGPSNFLPDNEGLPGVAGTHSSKSLRAGAMFVGASGRLLSGSSMVDGGYSEVPGAKIKLQDCLIGTSQSFLTMGLGYGLDASLGLPIYYESIPAFPNHEEALGIGDASLLLKAKLPGTIRLTSLAFFAQATVPTASQAGLLPKELAFVPVSQSFPDQNSHAMGSYVSRFGAGGGVTVDLSELDDGPDALLHLNILSDRVLAKDVTDPLATFKVSLASEVSPLRALRLQAEISYQILLADFSELGDPRAQATTINLGAGLVAGYGFSMQAGAVLALPELNPALPLTLRASTGDQKLNYRMYPAGSLYFSVAWHGFPLRRDTDHDGVSDGWDNCTSVAEDQDGYQDEDGCPELDNDKDGILDLQDNCPYAAEDLDGFEDRDGCPEVDNDHDGIRDSADACPNEAEDRDAFRDEDGCPEPDNDKDGILDSSDQCPMVAENLNGVEDTDGCPDADSDQDGISDNHDSCATEKEIINFYLDEDGCPDERPEPIRDGILAGVGFQPGTADLLPAADSVLSKLAFRLQVYSGTEIEIIAFLDDRSGAGAMALTEARAEAVADALNKLGIEIRRMKRTGGGATHPVAPNRTAKGREANVRVEIRRLN